MHTEERDAETEQVKERIRARVEWGAGDVLVEQKNREQMADRHAVASGEGETQHDEHILRDIHIGRRGSETRYEEQADKLRKTVQSEQEPSNSNAPLTMHVSLEYLASGDRQDRTEPVLVQNSGRAYKTWRWMESTRRTDERVATSKKCRIGIEKMVRISHDMNCMTWLRT